TSSRGGTAHLLVVIDVVGVVGQAGGFGAEVGGPHRLVAADVGGPTLGDELAEVDDVDVCRYGHNQVDVVLDEQDADVVLHDVAQHLLQVLGLGGVEPAAGLVEKHDSRPGAQCPPELDEAQHARGEVAGD